ncbi:MAG: metal ABC transporter substrate-binding protein [Acidimicrobiia bacterium]
MMLGTILIFSKRSGIRWAASILPLALVLGACGNGSSASEDLTIVATTSIAGDLVAQVVGDDATVEVLMPIGTDPHDFQPSSQQAASLRDADLVVAWGLGLEEGMDDVLDNAASDGVRIIELSALVDPMPYVEDHGEEDHDDGVHEDGDHGDEDHDDGDHEDGDHEDEDHGDEDGHEHGGLDAHTWMDPVRMATAVREIGAALGEIDPSGDWADRSERAADELTDLHAEVESILAVVPHERRKLVTNHDSFGYFASRYDFDVVGVAIPGGSTLGSPSSAQLASLIDAIRDAGVDVLFAETSSPAALLDSIADEIEGVRVVGLLEGSLAAPGEPGDTYAEMMVLNAETIAEALAP